MTTSTATGNATLNSTNYNTIAWTAVTGAYEYEVWRTAAGGTPSTTGLITTVASNVTTYNDQGAAGNTANGMGFMNVDGSAAAVYSNVRAREAAMVGAGGGRGGH